ncbi:MAG TPA: dTDP-glucose 4,6-dehydratase, partial [Bdellovibrionales bacterium]|nr:dTDP-glucose 4,6-dehydratase [Bdellovibrionales bacterium]
MTSTSRNLLVTGACGFIGSNFVRQRVAEGHNVTVLDALTYAGHKENLDGISGPGSVELVVGNICNGPLVAELLTRNKINGLINFAAESHVDRSIDAPSAFIETNINGTFTLLNASYEYWKTLPESEKNQFRYVQISTDEVYGSLGTTGKFHEKLPYEPNSPYSA